jgi:hypothetical protein
MQVARGRMHYILLHPTLNRRHSRGKDTSVSLSVVAAALPWNRRRGDFGHGFAASASGGRGRTCINSQRVPTSQPDLRVPGDDADATNGASDARAVATIL